MYLYVMHTYIGAKNPSAPGMGSSNYAISWYILYIYIYIYIYIIYVLYIYIYIIYMCIYIYENLKILRICVTGKDKT